MSARATVHRVGALGLSWAASCMVAWVLAVRVPLFGTGLDAVAPGAFPYDVRNGLALGLATFPVVFGLRLLARVRHVESASRRAAVVAAVTTPLSWPLAVELGGGDGLVAAGLGQVATAAVLVSMALGVFGLAMLHLVVAEDEPEGAGRWGKALLATALLGLGSGLAIARMHPAYAFLLGWLVPVHVAAIATTLLGALRLSDHGELAGGALTMAGVLGTVAHALIGGDPLELGRSPLAATSSVSQAGQALIREPARDVHIQVLPSRRCASLPPAAGSPRRLGRNLILITVDALRWDAPFRVRDGEPLMPNLRSFLEGSVYSKRAVATYPATLFSLGGAFTGLSPSQILFSPEPPRGLLARAAVRVDRVHAILPESRWLAKPAVGSYILQEASHEALADAPAQTEAAIAFLRQAQETGSSFVLWVHYFEPHAPHQTHAGFDFGDGEADAYDSELAFLDRHLAPLLRAVEAPSVADDTLVAFFADHGEALGERNYFGHHVYLHGYVSDVPLAFRIPGEGARAVKGTTSLLDVHATVADFLGLVAGPDSAGVSLLEGDPPAGRAVVSEAFPIRGSELFAMAQERIDDLAGLEARIERVQRAVPRYSPKVAIVRGRDRFIVDRQTGIEGLYDRLADPGEMVNRVDTEPTLVAELRGLLGAWHVQTSHSIGCRLERREGLAH